MDKKSEKFKEFERDEYELNLYGFTLNDFKRENFKFFNSNIHKSMQFMNKKFTEMMKDATPQLIEKVKKTTEEIEKKIVADSESGIAQTVNSEVDNCLRIPDNVILPEDRAHLVKFSSEDLSELQKEVDELYKISRKNAAFLKNLRTELLSYDLENCLLVENEAFNIAQHFLNSNYDTNLLKNSVEKLEIVSKDVCL